MKIAELPEANRPREKLIRNASEHLSDVELLAVLLRTGIRGMSAIELAQSLLDRFGSLHGLFVASRKSICAIPGIGTSTYATIKAALAIVERYYYESARIKPVFESSADACRFFISQLRREPVEVFSVAFLDNQHQLLTFSKLFFGTINSASVHPRVIVQRCLEVNAAAIMLAHNHPSGVTTPSDADKRITKRIADALALVDIRVLDHVIVGEGEAQSMARLGML